MKLASGCDFAIPAGFVGQTCLLFPNHSRPKAVNGYDFPRKAKHDSDYNSEYEHDYEHDYDYE